MASSKEYRDFIAEQLSLLDGISFRAMFGEYILYCGEKIAGGIFDDRLLVKPTPAALRMLTEQNYEIPYDGAKPMLLVDNVDDREFLAELLTQMFPELPAPRRKPGKQTRHTP